MRHYVGLFHALVAVFALMSISGCKDGGMKIEEIDPPFGNVAGGDDIVISGTGFKAGMTVSFGQRPAQNVIVESDTKIRLKTPAGPEGQVDVVVTDPTGKTYMLKNGYTYRKQAT